MKFVIRAYKAYSESAHALAEKLGCKVLKDRNSTFRYNPRRHTVINWGGGHVSHGVPANRFVNNPERTAVCTNKLRFFETITAVNDINPNLFTPIPPFTTVKVVAQQWLDAGIKVCSRQSLTGNSGEGLAIHRRGDVLPDAPLYVKYVKKTDEYRVHVFSYDHGEIQTRVVKKKLKRDAPTDRNKLIRNHENGYIFSADVGEVPACVITAATKAVDAMLLDFGAVDVGYDANTGTCMVYEVNTAPGIEGSTVDWYAEQFKKLLGE